MSAPAPAEVIAGADVLLPSWAAPAARVKALFTTRRGGVSSGPWGGAQGRNGLNLGINCGDDPAQVAQNRCLLEAYVGVPIRWLVQVHGTRVIERDSALADTTRRTGAAQVQDEHADAQVTVTRGTALGVLVADCLPVLLADRAGSIVGIAHAGWRGLAGGVLENTVASMRQRRPEADLVAWLGPCIGRSAFEVGEDVLNAFLARDATAGRFFRSTGAEGKWWADLSGLASQRLQALGIRSIASADACTVSREEDFWSYRRDGICGRMAGVIWLQA
jgi:YfiH family protein